MSAVSAQTLRNHWAIERRELKNRGFALGPIDHLIGGRSLGTVVSDSDVSLLIPVESKDEFAESDDLIVSIRRATFDMGDGEEDFLQLACRNETLEVVFAQLCSELIDAINNSNSPGSESRAMYDRWRALFAGRPGTSMSKSALVGLFGELQTLHELLQATSNREVSMWKGPEHSTHDFVRKTNHIEVKTTTSRNELVVEIHGFDQLDVSEGEVLHLIVHRVSLSDNGFTIDDQIERLVTLGADRIAIFEKLSQIGYDWADTKDYGGFRFRIEETRGFKVDDHFPRVVRSTFVNGVSPRGIVRLTYSLDLTSPQVGELNRSQLLDLYQGFSG
jgi:hypothetical protein